MILNTDPIASDHEDGGVDTEEEGTDEDDEWAAASATGLPKLVKSELEEQHRVLML